MKFGYTWTVVPVAPRCDMYPRGDAYNDNIMRDLQEMNQ